LWSKLLQKSLRWIFIQPKKQYLSVSIALFDLDNTLLGGDSDYQWGQFLVEQGIVDPLVYQEANERFYNQYEAGVLDIYEFSRFAFQPLKDNSVAQLKQWREEFIKQKIHPMMLAKGKARINWHHQRGDTVAIITATNHFVTEPIAQEFGIKHLLATEPKMSAGAFTGEISGTPCFQRGKVERLWTWLNDNQLNLDESWCYSDSHNDLPLLEQVSNPFAVDPDEKLLQIARMRDWKVVSFRN
jgi:HAD superfamily hydrolase (TIGR01490 family)